ncbi:MAG TPA: zf-HC2 domain-containing protein [Anaeromyxobacteraceae bacterium]|nr:zf-HC2 domain-containing protein [Anaeromyxobacteraceae bacterium]
MIPTCRHIVEHLGEWSEGRLPEEEQRPFAVHLELCPPCAHLASEYQSLARVARAALAVTMPDEARERLVRTLAARWRRGAHS